MYNEDAISAEFKALATQADNAYKAFASPLDPSKHEAHDETLARSCVYGYLYARHFLESPEKLTNELRWLKQTNRPRAPKHALSVESFQEYRDRLLDALVERFASTDPDETPG
jgi:hypothetical protein